MAHCCRSWVEAHARQPSKLLRTFRRVTRQRFVKFVGYCLSLTDESRRALQQAEPVLRAVEKDMLAAIPAKERAEWMETLRAVAMVALKAAEAAILAAVALRETGESSHELK